MPGLSLLPQGPGTVVSRAAQACNHCKKQKRRCDKGLPACGLCARMGRPCNYAETLAPPSVEDFAALTVKLAELENRLNGGGGGLPSPGSPAPAAAKAGGGSPLWAAGAGSRFPNAVFLDLDAFKWAGLTIPRPPVDVPMDVLEALGDGSSIQEAAATYFDTIHPWWPIISKKRMNMGIPLWDGGPDLAFLFLAMKLLISVPDAGGAAAAGGAPLYATAKRFAALLESSGTVSLLYLQGLVLIALYEYGHAVYPSAWMTVGACARYAEVLRLPVYNESCLVMGQCTTWTESEERRRVWWGIFILDRVIALGSKRSFALEEPLDTYILPVDDLAWDDGDMGRCLQRLVPTPLAEYQTPFARLVQVSMLISGALRYCRDLRHGAYRKCPEAGVSTFNRLTESLAQLGRLMDDALAAAGPPTPRADAAGTSSSSSPDEAAAAAAAAAAAHGGPETSPGVGVGGDTGAFLPPGPSPQRAECFLALLAPRCLALSALITLFDMHTCPESHSDGGRGLDDAAADAARAAPEHLMLQVRAVAGLREAALRLRDVGGDVVAAAAAAGDAGGGGDEAAAAAVAVVAVERVSPLALDAVYCAMATLHWLWKEGGEAATGAALLDTKACLGVVHRRWRLAGEYLLIEDLNDVTVDMVARAGL